LDEALQDAINTFGHNVQLVYELMDFDRLVQDQAIRLLTNLEQEVDDDLRYTARTKLSNGIQTLKNIRDNDSLRPHYEKMANQCVVLLVSYFGSAAKDVFRRLLQRSIDAGANQTVLKADWKMTVGEMASFSRDDLADTFIAKRDINFQDMQSIGRAFGDYLRYKPARDTDVNDIIVGHACRHVIVHAESLFDRKALGQIEEAQPRTLKQAVRLGEPVRFNSQEIRTLGAAMERYIRAAAEGADAALDSR
jgi:hypothetical protein